MAPTCQHANLPHFLNVRNPALVKLPFYDFNISRKKEQESHKGSLPRKAITSFVCCCCLQIRNVRNSLATCVWAVSDYCTAIFNKTFGLMKLKPISHVASKYPFLLRICSLQEFASSS